MRNFDKFFVLLICLIAGAFAVINLFMAKGNDSDAGRPYRVEVSRIVFEIEEKGLESVDLSQYKYVTNVVSLQENIDDFFSRDSDYTVRKIGDTLYRFDYLTVQGMGELILMVNIFLGVMSIFIVSLLLFIRVKILRPFQEMTELPYELSRGNLTAPVKENKSRLFGRFVWGINMLREKLEGQRKRELELQKEKKTLLLSLSHDIKTPLSAIKLYAKALSKGLYEDKGKQTEIAENIDSKADEIEKYVSEIIQASKEDFLELEVIMSEFYLSELIGKISDYYTEKLSLVKTEFAIGGYSDCLLKGDMDRSVEVLQNMIENAVKYGDGKHIEVSVREEYDCKLITIKNSGCSLAENELPHIFESFWRGSNAEKVQGSGLGLYICQKLMRKMGGEIFAEIENGKMCVTAVFSQA